MNDRKEPFDLKLTLLRMGRQGKWILCITLIGTLLLGGGYYVKNVVFRPERTYGAASIYKIDYAVETEAEVGVVYINEVSWNTYLHTDAFLDAVLGHLDGIQMSPEELSETLSAQLASDLRMPSTLVTTTDPEKSVQIALAVEAAMTQEFPELMREIVQIQVVESGTWAEEILLDVRPVRAWILGFVISFFFAVVAMLLKELGDSSIYLPATLRRRYGLHCLGTMESPELVSNVEHLFRGKNRIGVCSFEVTTDTRAAAHMLAEKLGDGERQWIPMPSLLLEPGSVEKLREMDGLLLVVPAGSHSGKPLEYVQQFLAEQEIGITATLLWEADESLIRVYYRLPGGRREEGTGI